MSLACCLICFLIPGSVAQTAPSPKPLHAAYIQYVRVNEGDSVQPGRTLVELDSRDLRAAVDQAEAARDGAESAVAAAAQQVRAAEAQLELARTTF